MDYPPPTRPLPIPVSRRHFLIASGCAGNFFLGGCEKMPTDNGAQDNFWITYPPTTDEDRVNWAGDDPRRRAAIARWLSLGQRDMIPGNNPGQLEEINFRGPVIQDEHLRDLALFPELTDVGLIGTSVTDAGVEVLTQLPNLDVVGVIECPNVTNAACKTLTRLSKLVALDLSKSPIGNEGVAALRGLQRLTRLELGDTTITSTALEYVAALPALQELDVPRTRINDDGLKYLRSSIRLNTLWVHQTAISDAGVAHLAGLKNMWQLLLRDTQIGDGSLRVVSGFSKLHTLDVQNTRVTSEGVAALRHLQKLQNLSLDGTAIDDRCVDDLAKIQSLRTLSLKETKVSLAGIERLRSVLNTQRIFSDFGLPKR